MDVLTFGLASLAGLLALISLLDSAATRLGLPFPVLASAAGLLGGLLVLMAGWSPLDAALDSYDTWFFTSLALTPQSVIFIFLPPLLFEMTLTVDIRKLRQDLVIVGVMAVVAVIAATLAVGGFLHLFSDIPLLACLLLGAAVSTTDPGAVVSTFRRVGAPRRLLVVLEGESLLNDAAAIALFALLVGLIRHGGDLQPLLAAGNFLYLFSVGALAGVAVAAFAARLLPLMRNNPLAQTSLSLAAAYASFLVAEIMLQASGVVAVVAAGLAWSVAATSRVSNDEWASIATVWAQLGYWSNGLIVLIAAGLVPGLIAALHVTDLPLVLLVIIGAFGARGIVLFALLPLFDRLGLAAPINPRQKLLVWWGGIRGAVTLLLAISLTTSALPDTIGLRLGAIGCAFVFWTLLVNAGSLAYVTRLMGLDRLSKSDRALRSEIVAGTMRATVNHVEELARLHDIPAEAFAGIRSDYEQRLADLAQQLDDTEAAFGDRLRTGLVILANQERRIVRHHYDDAIIGRRTMRVLQRVAENLADAAIVAGRPGYQEQAAASLEFPRPFRLAMVMQRYLGIDRFLSRMLARRFHLLFEWEIVLRDLKVFVAGRLEGLIGADAASNLKELIEERADKVEDAHRAMALQYPAYALQLRQAFIERAALRWEIGRYDRLLREAIISPEVHRSLLRDGQRRIERTFRPPKLDPGFDRYALIDRVTIFKNLSDEERKRIARQVRTHLVMPGEVVADSGERGHAVYFIASGALEMRYGDERTLLGSGEFFGELAILRPTRRRKSQVVALGFCHLLVLHREDVRKILTRHPELEEIMRSASETSRVREWVPIAAKS